MLKGMGGNIAVQHGKEGVLMVDTQFERTSESVLGIIEKETENTPQFIVNTHLHGDHTGGNKNYKQTGATVFSHQNVKDAMLAALYNEAEEKVMKEIELMEEAAKDNDKEAQKALERNRDRAKTKLEQPLDLDTSNIPSISFDNNLTIFYNDEEIKLIHLANAHTNGDVMVHFTKSNVIHTGDAFVNGLYPYIDRSNSGTYKGYQSAINTILQTANQNTQIIPGHGALATKADVAETKKILEFIYEKVTFHFLNDKTEDQVAQMRDITKFYDEKGYGDGFISTEKFLRSVYKAVQKNEGRKKARNEQKEKRYKEMQKRVKKEKDGKN